MNILKNKELKTGKKNRTKRSKKMYWRKRNVQNKEEDGKGGKDKKTMMNKSK